MKPPGGEDSTYRDALAVERTRLANERTLLSYIRTGLGLLGAGIVLVKLVSGRLATASGVGLVLAGIVVTAVGLVRFRSVQQRLARPQRGP